MMTVHSIRTASSDVDGQEDGVALFYALLVVLIVGGIIVVTFAASLTEQRQSAFELDFEDTLHVAEAGAEMGLQEVLADGTITNASSPSAFTGTEAEWAIEEASDPARTPFDVGEGEAVWLRPSSGSTEFVYGVGFVPSRDAYLAGTGETFVRVVRMEVGFTDPLTTGVYAFLANNIVNVSGGGSSAIYGSNGSIHTNGSFEPPTSSGFEVEGTVSFHDCDAPACSSPGYAETNTIVSLNAGTPEQVYATRTARDYVNDGDNWYDNCDGQWYVREVGSDAVPCNGDETLLAGNPPGFTGSTQNSSGAAGVYWFRNSAPDQNVDVQMSADDAVMTIITDGDINLPGGNSSFNWQSAYDGLHAYAGVDVTWGNVNVNADGIDCFDPDGLSPTERSIAAGIAPGIVYAGNNLNMSGNPTAVQISFIAQNEIRFSGGGDKCVVLETDGTGDLGGPGDPVVTQWDEVR